MMDRSTASHGKVMCKGYQIIRSNHWTASRAFEIVGGRPDAAGQKQE
jgi:hypothetical protein